MGCWTLDDVAAAVADGRLGPTHLVRHIDWPVFRPLERTTFWTRETAPATTGPAAGGRRAARRSAAVGVLQRPVGRKDALAAVATIAFIAGAASLWGGPRRPGPPLEPTGIEVIASENRILWTLENPGRHGAEHLRLPGGNDVGLLAEAVDSAGHRGIRVSAEAPFTLDLKRPGEPRVRHEVDRGTTQISF